MIKAAVFERGADSVPRFLDGGVRQADHLKRGDGRAQIRLNLDEKRVHPEKPHAVNFGYHCRSSLCRADSVSLYRRYASLIIPKRNYIAQIVELAPYARKIVRPAPGGRR